jgi:hypothetical protein
MARIYRKSNDSVTWHFCRNCSYWPAEDYEDQMQPPGTGQICNECKALLVARNCA